MELPHFLLADNTDQPDSVFIVHTEYPRFVWDIIQDEIEWMDDIKGDEEELVREVADLLSRAETFYDREMQRHEQSEQK